MSVDKIRVKLKKSTIKCTKKQMGTVVGLGLRKVGSVKVLENTSAVRGMVKKIIHFLDIEDEKEANDVNVK